MKRRVRGAVLGMIALAGCSLAGLDDGTDGGSPSDAKMADAKDACASKENCSNGVDDDCNGLRDCEDPVCQKEGFSCTPGQVPPGWTLVAYSPRERPLCPSGFGGEVAVVSDVAGADATCTCACSGSAAQCLGTTIYQSSPDACTTRTSHTVNVNNGACSPISASLTAGLAYQLDQLGPEPSPQQGTCSGAGMVQGSAPPVTSHAGATCGVVATSSAGCSSGELCAPPAPSPFEACIVHAGAVACPTFGFTQKTLASTSTPGYEDGRGCGACPCATSLGCSETSSITLFANAGCTGSAYGISIDCPPPVGSTSSVASYKVGFSTTGSASCQPTGASPPTGGVKLSGALETICCPP